MGTIQSRDHMRHRRRLVRGAQHCRKGKTKTHGTQKPWFPLLNTALTRRTRCTEEGFYAFPSGTRVATRASKSSTGGPRLGSVRGGGPLVSHAWSGSLVHPFDRRLVLVRSKAASSSGRACATLWLFRQHASLALSAAGATPPVLLLGRVCPEDVGCQPSPRLSRGVEWRIAPLCPMP